MPTSDAMSQRRAHRRERVEDADAGRIPEDPEGVGEPLDGRGGEEPGFASGGLVSVEVRNVAVVRHMNI